MNDPDPDQELRQALTDAVSDVDPLHRLDAIRARTSRPARPRRWVWLAAGGGAVVTASLVAAVVIAHGVDAPDVAADSNPSQPASTASDDATTASPSATPVRTHATALYFVGDTPQGPRLFREFRQIPDGDGGAADYSRPDGPNPDVRGPVDALGHADDPQYRTLVRAGVDAQVVEGQVRVWLSMQPRELGLQQLGYTLAAATGNLPVTWYRLNGEAFSLELDPNFLADVSISDPTEGRTVKDTFTARGVARSFEATVPWTITDSDGTVVKEYSAMAKDSTKLSPWKTRIDVSDLEPGTYTFTASTDDPTGGEGPGPTSDTRTIVVE